MLEIKNLTYRVDDEGDSTKEIIDGLDLTVEDGKFIVITGPNGGGKSTLAKLIMGVNQLTSGQIILDGVDISEFRFPGASSLQRHSCNRFAETCSRQAHISCSSMRVSFKGWTLR